MQRHLFPIFLICCSTPDVLLARKPTFSQKHEQFYNEAFRVSRFLLKLGFRASPNLECSNKKNKKIEERVSLHLWDLGAFRVSRIDPSHQVSIDAARAGFPAFTEGHN